MTKTPLPTETPINFSLEIYDNRTKKAVVNEAFSASDMSLIIATLQKTAKDLQEGRL